MSPEGAEKKNVSLFQTTEDLHGGVGFVGVKEEFTLSLHLFMGAAVLCNQHLHSLLIDFICQKSEL